MLAWLLLEMEVSDKPWQIIKKGRAGQIWKSNYLPPTTPLVPYSAHHVPLPRWAMFVSDIQMAQRGNAKLLQRIKINENKFSKLFFQPLSAVHAKGVGCEGAGGISGTKLTLENDSSVIKQSKRTKGRPARHCRHCQLPWLRERGGDSWEEHGHGGGRWRVVGG